MTPCEPASVTSRTLAGRLSEGRIPRKEALRYAAILAGALSELHEAGRVHGNISPESVILENSGAILTPPPVGGPAKEAASDISAFGLLVYELLSGNKAAIGESGFRLEPTGVPAADRLIAGCLGHSPVSLQDAHTALLELRLEAVSAGLADIPRRAPANASLRIEFQQLELRLNDRLAGFEKTLTGNQPAVNDSLNALRTGLDAMEASLETVRKSVEAIGDRLPALEEGVERARRSDPALEVKLAEVQKLGQDVAAQAGIIESLRSSLANNTNLVERVVEAMEAIQEIVLDRANARS